MIRRVFWDWDNTLCDSHEAWEYARCANFRAFGIQPPPVDEYYTVLGRCGGNYQLAYAQYGITATLDELNATYEEKFLERLDNLCLFPGAHDVLEKLERSFQIPSSIISAQSERVFLACFDRFPEIRPLITHVRYHIRNKAEAIKELARIECVRPWHCAYVGDTISDIVKARESGAFSVAFLNEHNRGVPPL